MIAVFSFSWWKACFLSFFLESYFFLGRKRVFFLFSCILSYINKRKGNVLKKKIYYGISHVFTNWEKFWKKIQFILLKDCFYWDCATVACNTAPSRETHVCECMPILWWLFLSLFKRPKIYLTKKFLHLKIFNQLLS